MKRVEIAATQQRRVRAGLSVHDRMSNAFVCLFLASVDLVAMMRELDHL